MMPLTFPKLIIAQEIPMVALMLAGQRVVWIYAKNLVIFSLLSVITHCTFYSFICIKDQRLIYSNEEYIAMIFGVWISQR